MEVNPPICDVTRVAQQIIVDGTQTATNGMDASTWSRPISHSINHRSMTLACVRLLRSYRSMGQSTDKHFLHWASAGLVAYRLASSIRAR